MKKKVTISTKGRFLKVFINGLPHLCLNQLEFTGFQASIFGDNWYRIEFYCGRYSILAEYDDVTLWSQILKLLNQATV